MITLQQRLRELSKEEFEALVHQILLNKFPGAGIKKSAGSGGDQGVDSFSGDLSDGPAIWQCKHFPDRIRRSQKTQILGSIDTAFETHGPKRWTLCIPIDLRTEEHQWFQSEVIGKYSHRATIDLIDASEILQELTYNRPLRDAFFKDNSISNALSIRQIALGTEKSSLEQMEQITIETAQQFLESNLDLEPRLQPVMHIGLSCPPSDKDTMAGSVFSVKKGNLAIDYIPRDPTTYNLDPISLQMTLNRANSDNLQKSINTGAPIKFPAGAILNLDSESPLLRHLFRTEDTAKIQMEIRPGIPAGFAAKEHPMRILASSPLHSSELSYIPFKVTQFGRKEITLVSFSHMPIKISIRLKTPPKQGANITIRPLIPGADSIELVRIFEFLDTLEQSGNLEIWTLDPPGRLLSVIGRFSKRLKVPVELRKVISEAALISKFFQVPLHIPEKISEHDLEKIQILKRIVTGEPLTQIEISANLIKDSAQSDNAMKFLGGMPMSIRIENPTGWEKIQIFGQTIDTGPIEFSAAEVTVLNGVGIQKEYLDAPEGATINWKGVCKGLCRFVPMTNPSQVNTPGRWTISSEEANGDEASDLPIIPA